MNIENHKVRFTTEGDVERILAIYAPIIRDSVVSFETVVPSLESFRARFNEICEAIRGWYVK